MATLADFHGMIRPYVGSGCPLPTIDEHLRLAIRDFCERTYCWRDRLAATVTAAASYQLYDPSFATIHRIEAAWFDNEPLEPAAFASFAPDELAEVGTPKKITQIDAESITLVPRGAGVVVLNAILKPPLANTATFDSAVPDHLLDQHGEALAAGARARLFLIPGQPWSDPGQAGVNHTMFDEARSRAANTHVRGQQRTRLRVKSRYL